MDPFFVVIVIGFVVLFAAIVVGNLLFGAFQAKRRLRERGDSAARHVGEYESQRGRIYPEGATNHQKNPEW